VVKSGDGISGSPFEVPYVNIYCAFDGKPKNVLISKTHIIDGIINQEVNELITGEKK
jgi:hypothetical protein